MPRPSHLLLALAPWAAAPSQDPSPLALESLRRARGQDHLARLAEHLVPPRHRVGVTVELQELRPYHAPRPDMAHEVTRTEHARVFGTAYGRQLEVTVTPAGEGAAPGLWRYGGDAIDGPGDALPPGEHLTRCLVARAPFPEVLVEFVARHGVVTGFEERGDGAADLTLDLTGGRVLLRTHTGAEAGEQLAPRLLGVDWLVHDDVLGDTVRRLTYGDGATAAPGVVRSFQVVGPRSARLAGRVVEVIDDTGSERDPRPPVWRGPLDLDAEEAELEVHGAWIGDDLVEVLVPAHQARVLALALPEGWCVMEAPVASRVGRKVLDVLAEHRPGLGVAYVLASHHHPHYVGALRPFVAAGARVVVPEGVAGYVEELLTAPRTQRPDRLSRADRVPEVIGVPFGERWSPRGAEDRLVALEAAGRSNHTEHFLVFALPAHGLGFGGDLLWISEDDSRPRRAPRTVGLALVLDELPEVEEFLTSWPVGAGADPDATRWRDRASTGEVRVAAGR